MVPLVKVILPVTLENQPENEMQEVGELQEQIVEIVENLIIQKAREVIVETETKHI